ncbi:hypothetical protein GGF46_000130 [Coemansia sp. RSA 552]|nr:hypothetical protein GGF46_000130 [Coemansia sp. RSA 552]
MPQRRRRVGVVPSTELSGGASDSDYVAVPEKTSAIDPPLRLIESSKATERVRGVKGLADLLREDMHGGNSLVTSISADTWERALSCTSGILVKEQQNFVNRFGEAWPDMPKAAETLAHRIQSQYLEPIRHTWAIAMPHLSPKLARYATKFITESLENDPCLASVAGLDYTKILRAWAAHEPHVYNCKGSRAKSIIDWCIACLSRFKGPPESQASADSVSTASQSIVAGDPELAAILHAIVAAATPTRLSGLSERVLGFCAEYCLFHTRENACIAPILDTANIILLSFADTQIVHNPERLKSMLETTVNLWVTRTAHLKLSVLYSIRILTRLVARIVSETGDPEARALLELTLKMMMSGAWDRHKFMTLPRELLGTWPLVHKALGASSCVVPLELFAPLHIMVEPTQMAFFDTVAYLAAFVTSLPPRTGADPAEHRRKRSRAAPTALSRLVTAIGSEDSAANVRGAAKVIWYIAAVYTDLLGEKRCAELLGDISTIVCRSDTSQRADLAEWMLGSIRMLNWRVSAQECTLVSISDIWQHAIAGIEVGLAGAAGLALDILQRPEKTAMSSDIAHLRCRQAADALDARSAPHDADSTRLLLFVMLYLRPTRPPDLPASVAADDLLVRASAHALTSVCESAAKQCWPVSLFSTVLSSVLGASEDPPVSNCSVFDPAWATELRFSQVLHMLAALEDNAAACTRLLEHHVRRSDEPLDPIAPGIIEASSASPAQWGKICMVLLEFIEAAAISEAGQVLMTAVPYVAHTVWRVSLHLSASAELLDASVGSSSLRHAARGVVHGFAERFLTLVAECNCIELIWQTMAFIAPWTDGYTGIAALEAPMDRLLGALFGTGDFRLLCEIAQGNASSMTAAVVLGQQPGCGAAVPVDTDARLPDLAARATAAQSSGDPASRMYRDWMEARMLCASSDMVHLPGKGMVSVLSALAVSGGELVREKILTQLNSAVSHLDEEELLVAAELLVDCVLLTDMSPEASALLATVNSRMFSFLESYNHMSHMPTIFAVLRVACKLVCVSAERGGDVDKDEDLARFVGWIAVEAQEGRISPFVEVELSRSLLGPWSRAGSGDERFSRVLSALEQSPVDMLLYRAQTAMGFVSRLVAEEQLAQLGLSLPFLQPDGHIAYPDAPDTSTDDLLVLVTRDIGLAMLTSRVKSVPPGVLTILLQQMQAGGISPRVTRLCKLLLTSIAGTAGLASIEQLVTECASDIFSIDPELYDIVSDLTRQRQESSSQLRVSAALEWMLRGELARAKSMLPGFDTRGDVSEWVLWLLAHLLVLSISDKDLYTRVVDEVLAPQLSAEAVESMIKKHSEGVTMHLLLLYRPEATLGMEISQVLASMQESHGTLPVMIAYVAQSLKQPTIQQTLPQWGRRYNRETIQTAIGSIVCQSGAVELYELFASPFVAWLALQLELRLREARWNDQRQRLVCSLCLLVSMAKEDVLDSPLVQSVLVRTLADGWLSAGGRTSPICCLIVAVLIDCSTTLLPAKVIGSVGTGFIRTLSCSARTMDKFSLGSSVAALVCLLSAVCEALDPSHHPADSHKLLIGSEVEGLYDWAQLAPLVMTRVTVQKSSDRMSLARIAEAASTDLDRDTNILTRAELLASAVERALHLALPQDPYGEHDGDKPALPGAPADGATMNIDLSASVAKILADVRQKVTSHLRKSKNAAQAMSRTSSRQATTLLLRVSTLLHLMLEQLPADEMAPPNDRKRLAMEGDLNWLVYNAISSPHNQDSIVAAARVASELDPGSSSAKWTDGQQKWLLHDASRMPAIAVDLQRYPPWMQQREERTLDLQFLESICGPARTASSAFCELVCALTVWKACAKFHSALPLMWADQHTASCLLPHIICEILPKASPETREEIAAFLLDFAHNWRERAPSVARDVIIRTLEVRQLDSTYSDIREFFKQLPLALFEMADMAAKLDMPETTAFLLECDLTCTNPAENAVSLENISAEAKELLRSVYRKLGNQPAAQLLSSVSSVSDVLSRCRDTADWRTLLLYQEAASEWHSQQSGVSSGAGSDFGIGDTLVNLGLFNTIRPGIAQGSESALAGLPASNSAGLSQAAYAASWRLAKWDVPAHPSPIRAVLGSEGSAVGSGKAEELLYGMFRLRSSGQLSEAAQAVQEYMATPEATSALTMHTVQLRESWPFHAVSTLLPLVGGNAYGALGQQEFVSASQAAMFLLSRNRNILSAEALEPIALASLSLHEVALHETIQAAGTAGGVQKASAVFRQYKEAVRVASLASRRTCNWQASMNHIFRLRAIARQCSTFADKTLEPELRLWEAETLWDSGNRSLAIEILQSHRSEMEEKLERMAQESTRSRDSSSRAGWTSSELETATILLSRVILTVGEWSDKQRTERPAVLWEEYFNKSAKLLQKINSPTTWTGRALHALAEFSERQCEELTSTRDNEATMAMRRQKTRELAACQQEIKKAGSASEAARLRGILRRLEIQVTNDQKELDGLRGSIGGFLSLAIWSFVKCLECTDAFDNCVYSLVSLVVTHARSPELEKVLVPGLTDSVPSRKFLPLIHQLCARLGTENDAFHTTVTKLVTRMAVDYPYHAMYHLFALRNANRTSSAAKNMRRSTTSLVLESETMEERRSEAARGILRGVASKSDDLWSIVHAIDTLCDAYIDLAVCPVPEKYRGSTTKEKMIAFSGGTRIAKLIKNLPQNIPVLTAVPRPDTAGDYMCVPFISSIWEGYSLAGGINLPKITRVLGTDGRRYKQLVKGKDDLRQDAIIQQLFHVINQFMTAAPRKNTGSGPAAAAATTAAASASGLGGLRVRTYQVVPLTKRCGVLQWVDNTMPFGDWFRANEARYRPDAPTITQLRSVVHDVHKNKAATAQEKEDVFERVKQLAPPVFRFFFYEHFCNAQSWFEHRETYIRSAAVSSIAGWVLGIGDRHLQNILVDQHTAEVVHIDLGIAFDLGKLLPIPELVPFRLTREMVDGMGLLGLRSTFHHFCQVALRAMRDNARVVITILNVLKVDPLYVWSLIPLRLNKMNRNVSMYVDESLRGHGTPSASEYGAYLDDETNAAAAQEENKEAGRSIMHVGQRLSANISVEGQVSELIQQATDARLLSRMFEGWSAWY